MVRIQIIGLVCLMLWFSALQASDLLREERMAAEIEEAILVGDPVWLQAGEQRFFAIHALSELNRTYGGVIILHGRGAHPDWSDVINPLRSELPAHGWQTLSIQLPVAEAGAKDLVYQGLIPEALPRIAAAIDYFDQQGVQNVAIVAHSLGTLMGTAYLAENADSDAIKGFVAISMPLVEGEGAANVPEVLGKLKVPMLDIYGSRDIASVRNTVRQRAIAIRKGEGNAYRSLEIEGADHFFIGLESVLVGRVNGWLRTVITTVD